MKKEYQVKYFIMFHDHEDLQIEETMTVYSTDKVWGTIANENGNFTWKYVDSAEDAEQFAYDQYQSLGEERLVDIPQYVWDTNIGSTLFEVTKVTEVVEE